MKAIMAGGISVHLSLRTLHTFHFFCTLATMLFKEMHGLLVSRSTISKLFKELRMCPVGASSRRRG